MAASAHERANALEAGLVVRLAKIHRAADLRVHLRAAQFLGRNSLPDGGLHQRRAGQKKPRAFRHQNVVAHHRQISAAGDAHAHDGGDLRNAHRAHHRVIAKHAAEIVGIRENVLLQRQKNARGIDQIDRGNAVFDRDVLRADHFLRGHREKRPGFYGGVVRDDHHQPARDSRQAGNRARRRRAAPFLIHFVSGVNAQLEKFRSGIDQARDALARREPALFVLRFDGFCSAALLQPRFFVFDFGEQVHHAPHVLFELGRIAADAMSRE